MTVQGPTNHDQAVLLHNLTRHTAVGGDDCELLRRNPQVLRAVTGEDDAVRVNQQGGLALEAERIETHTVQPVTEDRGADVLALESGVSGHALVAFGNFLEGAEHVRLACQARAPSVPHAVDAQGDQGDADDGGQELSHEGSLFRLGSRSMISAWVGEVGGGAPGEAVVGVNLPPPGTVTTYVRLAS